MFRTLSSLAIQARHFSSATSVGRVREPILASPSLFHSVFSYTFLPSQNVQFLSKDLGMAADFPEREALFKQTQILFMNRNVRKQKKPNHGARPVNNNTRRKKNLHALKHGLKTDENL